MKIDSDGLKALYREHVRSQNPSSRQDCPSPEDLLLLVQGGGSRKKKKLFVDHLSSCGECAREFGFVVEAARAEAGLVADLARSEPTPAAARPFFLRLSWGIAPLVVGVFVAGFVLWKTLARPSHEAYRATPASRIELISPLLASADPASLAFVWKTVAGAESYRVEVFDEALQLLWRSEPVMASRTDPPPELKAKLVSGRIYFWMVTGRFPEGDTRASALQEFRLKK